MEHRSSLLDRTDASAQGTKHDLIMRALAQAGCSEVHCLTLATQEKPSDLADTIDVPLLSLVFPVEPHLEGGTKKVYVNRNFRDIFNHVCDNSGWLKKEDAKKASVTPLALVHVSGPPGSGKSLAAYAALRYLAGQTGRSVLYLSCKSARLELTPTFAVLIGDNVYFVVRNDSSSVEETVSSLYNMLLPDGVFLDGLYGKDLCRFAAGLRTRIHGRRMYDSSPLRTSFMGVTTSMISHLRVFPDVVPFKSSPWLLKDYLSYAEAVQGRFTSEQLRNLNCEDGANLTSIKAAIRAKFLVAGHSCRFMFDRTASDVAEDLRAACNSVTDNPIGKPEESAAAVNTLMVTIDNKCMPVSLTAAGIMAHNISPKYGDNNSDISTVIKVAQKGHRPMLGWLFEEEVLDHLLSATKDPKESAGPIPAAASTGSNVSAGPSSAPTQRMAADADQPAVPVPVLVLAQTVDSVAETLGSVCLSPLLTMKSDYQLRRYPVGSKEADGIYEFPEECHRVYFNDDIDLVRQLLNLAKEKKTTRPVLCIPLVYAYPFLDLLLLRWSCSDPLRLQLEGDSFQITIAARHSCDATVVQSIANCMAMCGMELTAVTHYPILPSATKAAAFQFTSPDNLELRTPLSRKAKTAARGLFEKILVKRAIDQADMRAFEPAGKERRYSGVAAPVDTSAAAAFAAFAALAAPAALGGKAEDGLGEEEAVLSVEGLQLLPQESPKERKAREKQLMAQRPSDCPVVARIGTTVKLACDHLVLKESRVGSVVDTIDLLASK